MGLTLWNQVNKQVQQQMHIYHHVQIVLQNAIGTLPPVNSDIQVHNTTSTEHCRARTQNLFIYSMVHRKHDSNSACHVTLYAIIAPLSVHIFN